MPLETTLLVERPALTGPFEAKTQVQDGPTPKYIPTDKNDIPISRIRRRFRTMVLDNDSFTSSYRPTGWLGGRASAASRERAALFVEGRASRDASMAVLGAATGYGLTTTVPQAWHLEAVAVSRLADPLYLLKTSASPVLGWPSKMVPCRIFSRNPSVRPCGVKTTRARYPLRRLTRPPTIC